MSVSVHESHALNTGCRPVGSDRDHDGSQALKFEPHQPATVGHQLVDAGLDLGAVCGAHDGPVSVGVFESSGHGVEGMAWVRRNEVAA